MLSKNNRSNNEGTENTNLNVNTNSNNSNLNSINIENNELNTDNSSNNNLETKEKTEEQKKKELEETIMPESSKTKLLTMKDNAQKTVENYKNEYRNSAIYGTIAYILKVIQTISIPIVVLGLIASYVYQTVLGNDIRDVYQKGRRLRTNSLIFLAVAQVAPLVFAILVKGWGN